LILVGFLCLMVGYIRGYIRWLVCWSCSLEMCIVMERLYVLKWNNLLKSVLKWNSWCIVEV